MWIVNNLTLNRSTFNVTYLIAKLYISWEKYFPLKNWEPFLYEQVTVENNVKISLLPCKTEGSVIRYFAPLIVPKQVLKLGEEVALCTEDWTRAEFLPGENYQIVDTLARYIFYTHAVRRQMIQLHAATIEDQGRGILFLGPSGIGKTTQAERWAEFRGSSIINGDVGFVQRTEREYIAWGTPWHGSSPYCLNASVPVKALVVLKQAPENRLRELTGFEKVTEVSGSVFYPTWLDDGMELCTDTLNHLLTDLPVYRLDNRADRESVEILAKELDRIT